jgi:hypothetical protein
MSRHRTTGRARRWAGGIGTAAAAAATIGMGTAHADEGSVPADIGLLNTAQTDIAEAFSLSGHTNADAGFFPELEAIQTPLLSSDNSFVSGFGEVLFNGPDQQLAQASETFLSAAETLSSDTTNFTALGDYASTGFQVTGAIFGEIPSTLIGKLTDQIFDIGGFDTASAGAAVDVATSTSAVAAADLGPADLLGEASTNLTDASQVLSGVPASDAVDLLSTQLNLQDAALQVVGNLDTAQGVIDSYDNGALAELVTPFFNSMDQGWVSVTETLLNADQAFDVALVGGTGVEAAELAVITADLGLAGDALNSFATDFASLLF